MLRRYVLITPARNEAQFIELTLRSVVEQTVRPARWIIVSDGSSDGTDEVVQRYAGAHLWIELVHMPDRGQRDFAGKVHAFNAGLARVMKLDYDAIGSLDADISFESDYFAFLLSKLAENPDLGLVGTPFRDGCNAIYDYRFANIEHVSGACQLFRRQCFDDVGGYVPVKGGCIDHIAVISARMKNWKTRTFTEKVCLHHRAMGTAQHGLLSARFKNGGKDYAIGNHPIWELFRVVYQMGKRPYVMGGLMLACGYAWAAMRRTERPVSSELVRFYRHEQMVRLRRALVGGKEKPLVFARSLQQRSGTGTR